MTDNSAIYNKAEQDIKKGKIILKLQVVKMDHH